MLGNAMNNVLKFAATAAQETPGIFDRAPVESVARPASGFLETCTDWVSENKTAVIGAGAVAALGVGAYYSYPWIRDRIRDIKGSNAGSKPATAQAESAAPTAEEVRDNLDDAINRAREFTEKNPKAGKK